MFDLVHNNKRLVQVILALIILPFAIWGVSSYERSGSSADVIATVNGLKITQQEFENSLRNQQDKMRKQLGASYDPAMFDKPGIKSAILNNLISQRLLIDSAQSAKLVVTDNEIAKVIGDMEDFHDNGKFNKKLYATVLENNRMTPLMYERLLRDELLVRKIQETYISNGFASDLVSEKIFRLNGEQRIVRTATISAKGEKSRIKVEDEEIKNYYDQHQSDFQVPEQVKVEYVRFSVENLLAKAEVHNDDVRKYYEARQKEFGTPEERRASHILITVAPNASQSDKDAAKAKAEALLKQAKEDPARFADLARKNSQDPGSAANGGDLDYFGRGVMDKPFEDAAFGLRVGEISDLVQSKFGYHIIKLVAIKASKVPPFEKVRGQIESKLRQQIATDKFAELAEKFSNTVYEQSDTLKSAADLVGARVEQSGWISKGVPNVFPWTDKMLQAVFSDDVIKNKRNTPAIEVKPNELVAARLLQHKPASVRTLDEMRDTVRQKLTNQHAFELAIKNGKTILEKLQHGEKVNLGWDKSQTVTRLKHGTLRSATIRKIFQANTASLPQYVGVEEAESYLIVRIDTVKEVEGITEADRAQYAQNLRQLTGEEMFQAFISNAKAQAKIRINLPEKNLE